MTVGKMAYVPGETLRTSVSYVPGPNTMTFTTTACKHVPVDNTTASFAAVFYKDQLVLARNLRRGIEISGGHIEKGETAVEAAIRETAEEIGAVVNKVHFYARSTLICEFDKPENYKYPFPVSHMDFFFAEAESMTGEVKEDEVGQPVLIPTSVEDDVIIRDLSVLSDEDRQSFLDNMKKDTFRFAIDQATLHYFAYKEKLRRKSLKKFWISPKDNIGLAAKAIEEAGGEPLHYNDIGDYIIAGFVDYDTGQLFQRSWNVEASLEKK